MKSKLPLGLTPVLSVVLFGCLNLAECQTNATLQWKAYSDGDRRFHFQYPSSWKINPDGFWVEHYREVFVSVNSFGADHFALREQQISSNSWEYGARTIASQMPVGGVCLEISRWDFPGPRWGPNIHEMTGADLSTVLKTAEDVEADGLITRKIEFSKWGTRWRIMVYLRPPVSIENSQTVEKILDSFHFDGVPSGDPIWALGEARKKLPPEADPDKFSREGGSSEYYNSTQRDSDSWLVTFSKHLEGQAIKIWTFRVTETGEVRQQQEP